MDKAEKIILISFAAILVGCLLLSVLCGGFIYLSRQTATPIPSPAIPTHPVCSLPVQETISTKNLEAIRFQNAQSTQANVAAAILPVADLNELAARLLRKTGIPRQLDALPIQYQLGDQLDFYKLDGDSNNIPTRATLKYATSVVYFWVEEGIFVTPDEVKTLVDTFSESIYPTDRAFFGSEWLPGVDNDPHLFILYAGGVGTSVAGYTATNDSVLTAVYPYSNMREMFVINADIQSISDVYTFSTMAHEFEHVIMDYRDPDEELWLNEGFAELATLINGYDAGGFDSIFLQNPDVQLNNWSADGDVNDQNYGAGYLFTTYLLSRFGEDITRQVAADALNGLASFEHVFAANDIADPQTGKAITVDAFFQDWTITNLLNDSAVEDGRYANTVYPEAPTTRNIRWLGNCDGRMNQGTVHQFGSDYFQITCDQAATLRFTGSPYVNVLPDGSNSSWFLWSNRGDRTDTRMTREFDFSGFSAPLNLYFDVWFDLETDFDYAYLMAKPEGGQWEILPAGNCVLDDPSGNKYGCAFTGQAPGWQTRVISLSKFAGQKVTLRFESISDGALSMEGMAVDNLSIPEIGYREDFENGDGGWQMEGFVRINNELPQTFLVSLIITEPDFQIKKFQLQPGEELNLFFDPGCFESDPILIISGSTQYTRQVADYSFTLSQ